MQKRMITFKILFFVIFLTVENHAEIDTDEITEEKAADMYNCLCIIACDLGHVFELERIAKTATPDLQEKGMSWYGDCYGIRHTSMKEFFDNYMEGVCPLAIHKKRECFKEFILAFGNHFEKICGEEYDEEECAGAERAMDEGKKVIEEYTLKGDCYNAEDMANKTLEDGTRRITGYNEDELKEMGFGK